MEFTSNRRKLQEALQLVGGVAMLRTVKDALQSVYIDARPEGLILKATDCEVGIEVRIPDVTVARTGVVLLPAAHVMGIFRELSEPEVIVRSDGSGSEILSGRSRFRVVELDAGLFPGLPEFPGVLAGRVATADLVGMIRHVVFSSAEERTRYAFDGIKLEVCREELRMVSTDGKRLSYYRMPHIQQEEGMREALLPARALGHFGKALVGEGVEADLAVEGNRFGIRSQNVVLYCQQIEGSFPNFLPLVEKELPHHVMLDAEELLRALRRASVFAVAEARVVRLRLGAGNLNVRSNPVEQGEAETDVAVEYDGEPVELAFNPDYLTDYLKLVGANRVRVDFKDEQTASRWSVATTPSDEARKGELLYLVMPVTR